MFHLPVVTRCGSATDSIALLWLLRLVHRDRGRTAALSLAFWGPVGKHSRPVDTAPRLA
jgi:hypothetical protein